MRPRLLSPAVKLAIVLAALLNHADKSPAARQETPRLVPQIGHPALVQFISSSRDGKLLLTGGDDSTVRLWDVASGKLLRYLSGLPVGRFPCGLSTDGRYIMAEANDYSVRVWSSSSGLELEPLRGHKTPILSIASDPESRIVMAGSIDGTVLLWDLGTGRQLHRIEGEGVAHQITSTAFSPDGRFFAFGRSDRVAVVWDSNRHMKLRIYAHAGEVVALAFGPDGNSLLAGCDDGTVVVWNLATGEQVSSFKGPDSAIQSIVCTGKGNCLVCANKAGGWFVCDLAARRISRVSRCQDLDPQYRSS